ncbi:MAG: HD domain-containing phosphohydrolase [Planctomycetota bacterium]
MSEQPEGAPAGEDRDFAQKVRGLISSFGQLVRVTALHSVENLAVVEPLRATMEGLTSLASGPEGLSLRIQEEGIFANGKALRFTSAHFATMKDFIDLLTKKGIAKISFPATPDEAALKAFLQALHGSPKGDPEVVLRSIRSGLPEAVRAAVALMSPKELEHETARLKVQISAEKVPVLVYTKVFVLLDACVEAFRCGEYPARGMGRLQRAVQELVAHLAKDADPFQFVLARTRLGGDYLRHHPVRVAALAILAGMKMGLDRLRLSDLGVSALFHALGRSFLPSDLQDRPGALSKEEHALIARHPALAVKALLGTPKPTESLMTRIVVAFEYNRDANGYPAIPGDRRLHLFSRIVAACDAWDAMSTPRPWRKALAPTEAFAALQEGGGKRWDPIVLKALLQAVRVYPPGMAVRLTSGERSRVLRSSSLPSEWDRPWVLLEADADGKPLSGIVALRDDPVRKVASVIDEPLPPAVAGEPPPPPPEPAAEPGAV